MNDRFACAIRIDADHPCLPGHFPGQPIVPGVVLLDRIAAALEQGGRPALTRLSTVKFLAPLLPGEDAVLACELDGRRVRFRIDRGDTPIMTGDGETA